MCFDFIWAEGIEDCVWARAVAAFGGGRWAAGGSWAQVSIFGASWVFAAVLGSGVSSGANRAGRGHVEACLVWMSESVAVPAVGSGVC